MQITPKERKWIKEIQTNETVVNWTPWFKFDGDITFNGTQFEAWIKDVLPQAQKLRVVNGMDSDLVKERGISIGQNHYLYCRRYPTHVKCMPGFLSWRTKPWIERMGLKLYAPGKHVARAHFDRPVAIPILAQINRLDRPWMSLTPNEVMTQRAGVLRARGNVLVAGFGLGWFVQEILKRKRVKHVTVVEIHEGVVEHLAKPLASKHKDRVTVVCKDVWEYLATTKKTYDRYLFDIWEGWPNAHYDDTFQKFKREHEGKVWGWGDCSTYPIEPQTYGWY